MVHIEMLPQPGTKLDLTQLHSAIHNLVLSRREDVGFWTGPLETAWAGFVFASHTMPNQDHLAINLIKGELLGKKRPGDLRCASEVASCYMIAAFLHRIGATEVASDLVATADARVLENVPHIDLDERFQFLSTPEYLYAIVLAHHITDQVMPDDVRHVVLESLNRIQNDTWHQSGYVFALAGTAYLLAHRYSENACLEVLDWLSMQLSDVERVDEHSIPVVWFLEQHLGLMGQRITSADEQRITDALIRLRSKLFHSLGSFDFELTWSPLSEGAYDERPGGTLLVVSTIELLMLDEIADKHSQQSFVLTRDELDRHGFLSTVFDQYKQSVDEKLNVLGIGSQLDAVYRDLEYDDPGSWRNGVLGCRNVLYDLSKVLWQVPGDEYEIPGTKTLNVKDIQGNERNRLTAYMHHSGISKTKNPVLMAEFDAMSSLMHALVNRCAKAKQSISREEAMALLIGIYVLLGEMVALTGLDPAVS